MGRRMTPMVHVPDVRGTALWYESVGFALAAWHGCDADGVSSGPLPDALELDWALLRWGEDDLMLNAGGITSIAPRREADLYLHLDAQTRVDAIFERLQSRVDIVEPPFDAFHGARELIIRDPNGFWITFAEALPDLTA